MTDILLVMLTSAWSALEGCKALYACNVSVMLLNASRPLRASWCAFERLLDRLFVGVDRSHVRFPGLSGGSRIGPREGLEEAPWESYLSVGSERSASLDRREGDVGGQWV